MKQQAAVFPFRRNARGLEICLIRKKGLGKRWGIPKGFIARGDTSKETALKEAREEAGLHGRLVGGAIGRYEYRKWGTTLEVAVYLMQVKREQDDWDEANFRKRRWTPLARAEKLLARHPARSLMPTVKRRLS
jgi:8-oxo-dGTP pyrophosphatase MutT (NUDIX family)